MAKNNLIYTKNIYYLTMDIAEAKLFKNGQSQAVRLPKNFRFKGKSVCIKHFGKGVILFPKNASWALLEESLDEFTDDFMNSRDQETFEDREGGVRP